MILRRDPFPNFPERPSDLHRCLLVAHDGAPTPRLCRLMEERCRRGPCEMHVVVSRFRRTVLVSDPSVCSRGAGDITVDDQAWDVAEARLDSFMRALGDLGQPLSGEILSGNLLRRVRRLLRFDDFDEVVVMTSGDRGRWPSRDLAEKVKRAARVPVTTVVADDLAI